MPETLLHTKLFIPPLRPNLVPRPHLIECLNQGLHLGHKLTLVSAPLGFGKTTLVSEWVYQWAKGGGLKDESEETSHPASLILRKWPGRPWTRKKTTPLAPIRSRIYRIEGTHSAGRFFDIKGR
jgi:hypothetical protein